MNICEFSQIHSMPTTKEAMKQVIEEKQNGTKQQGKLKRPDKLIGEPRKRIKARKGGGLFDGK